MNTPIIPILFGTQTGNAEDIAERTGRHLTRMRLKSSVHNIQTYPISRLLEEKLVIFVCSTTGNGEFPDNMRMFWKFLLRKNLPNDSLSHLNFCIFGLGDSSYDKFNVVAKKLNKRLLQLGANELVPLALADDQHELGYDATLDSWFPMLKNTLSVFFDINEPYISDDVPLPSKYTVSFANETDIIQNGINGNKLQKEKYELATVIGKNRMTSMDHFQTVHLIKFSIGSEVSYEPGDVAVVRPENPSEQVEEFLSLLNVPPDDKFTLSLSDSSISLQDVIPYPCTVRECVQKYFDILSIPRRSFFEFFLHFSRDETEKEKLLEFTTAEGQEELYTYCNRPRRTILEVLQDFPYTTPYVPFEYFFDMIPSIRPRSYSIASSIVAHPCEFQLLVAVVKYRTRLQKPREGLCSNWLSSLKEGTEIPYYIKKGGITLPKSDDPVIMIGPGTGCAPFRAFVEHRASKNVGDNYLFFGCRYKDKDFLCSETWKNLVDKNMLTLITAFSRDQEDKIYVQHRITENSALVWKLLSSQNASIYVAGNAKQMPQSVKEAILAVFETEGHLTSMEAVKYFQTLELKKKYQVETWA